MAKNILITGAGSGFGKGTAVELAARGHSVTASTETSEQATALGAARPRGLIQVFAPQGFLGSFVAEMVLYSLVDSTNCSPSSNNPLSLRAPRASDDQA